jgi:hypothetical protein
VPPFKVVDVTLPAQPYPPRIAIHFGGIVVAEEFSGYVPVAGDLYENELVELVIKKTGRAPTLNHLEPRLRQFMMLFPAFGIDQRDLRIKYVPTQISAIDADLEEMRNLCLSGMYPLQLYEKFAAHKKE